MIDAKNRHVTEAVRQAANNDWPQTLEQSDVFRIIVFIEAAAMVGVEEALQSFDTFYEEALEDKTWDEYLSGHDAQLKTFIVTDIQRDKFGCADPETAAHYATLTTKAPPIFIKDGIILDGNHRIEAAVLRGDTQAQAYVIAKAQIAL